jgi:GNAT superfamily N-acetyltransferase
LDRGTSVEHKATDLLVARLGSSIVGMARLVTFPLSTGYREHVDDVVVDEALRGRGIARELLNAIIFLCTLTTAADP